MIGAARGRTFRRRTAVVCLAAGGFLTAGPFLYPGVAATQPANTGSANTGSATVTVALPAVSVTDPVGGNRALSLGSLTVGAQSYPTRWRPSSRRSSSRSWARSASRQR